MTLTITRTPDQVIFERTYASPVEAYSALSELGHTGEGGTIHLLRAFCCADSPYSFMASYYEYLSNSPENVTYINATLGPGLEVSFTYVEPGVRLELHDTTLTCTLERNLVRRGADLYEQLTRVLTDGEWLTGQGLVTPQWVPPNPEAVLRFLGRAHDYQAFPVEGHEELLLLWHPLTARYFYSPARGTFRYLKGYRDYTFVEVCRKLAGLLKQ